MTAEQKIAEQLQLRVGSLVPGARLLDDLLDVALSDSYPPVIRLVADVGSVGAAEGPGQGRREAGPQGSGQGRT